MGNIETREPPIRGLSINSISGSLISPRCQVIFQWKQTKEKLGNAFGAWRNFCVDLTWQMENTCQFSLGFLGLVRVSHFAQAISFTERPQGKVHPRKVNKTNKKVRDSWNKTTSTHYGNRQRNIMIKSKQISFEGTRTWDCFMIWKVICVMY